MRVAVIRLDVVPFLPFSLGLVESDAREPSLQWQVLAFHPSLEWYVPSFLVPFSPPRYAVFS